jgi:ABC-type transport system involved in multi-copper enzyme maturation permease subunit
MSILAYELKKLLFSPMLIVFLALCIGFNFMTIGGAYYEYSDYVAEASRTTGYNLGAAFDEKLAGIEPGEMRDWLMDDTAGITDVFDGYDTAYIADAYIKKLGLTGYAANAIRDKYAGLQKSIDAKAEIGESMTLYFASATTDKHDDLYYNTMLFLILQCGLIAALIMLLSIGYEHHNRTSHIVYATKTGRKVMRYKLFASLTAGIIAFALLTVMTLAVYFAVNDYGNIWGSSVSSAFHVIDDMLAGGNRPFATWQSYTVLTYLLASLGVSALLTVCFGLMAYVIGMWLENSYIGFLIFMIINAGCIVFAIVIQGLPKYFAVLSPVWLWLKRCLWFTDGGPDILWKNFETAGVFASLIIFAGLGAFSAIIFRKRDIT